MAVRGCFNRRERCASAATSPRPRPAQGSAAPSPPPQAAKQHGGETALRTRCVRLVLRAGRGTSYDGSTVEVPADPSSPGSADGRASSRGLRPLAARCLDARTVEAPPRQRLVDLSPLRRGSWAALTYADIDFVAGIYGLAGDELLGPPRRAAGPGGADVRRRPLAAHCPSIAANSASSCDRAPGRPRLTWTSPPRVSPRDPPSTLWRLVSRRPRGRFPGRCPCSMVRTTYLDSRTGPGQPRVCSPAVAVLCRYTTNRCARLSVRLPPRPDSLLQGPMGWRGAGPGTSMAPAAASSFDPSNPFRAPPGTTARRARPGGQSSSALLAARPHRCLMTDTLLAPRTYRRFARHRR